MSLGSTRSTILKSFPQEINIPWQGGKTPFLEIQRLARISHGAKAPGEVGEGLDLNLWLERKDEFIGAYERNRVQSSWMAGDIEALPKKHKIQLQDHNSIPLNTPVDRKLDHLRRVAKTRGRNNAISAADIAKAQLADHRGGIVSDIRPVHPLEPKGKEPDYFIFKGDGLYLVPGKRKTEFMPIPRRYGPILGSDSDLLVDAERFTADFLITRPGTKATEDLKNRMAVRNSIDFSRIANNPEGYKPYPASKIKDLINDEEGLNLHPLSLSHRFDERQRQKAIKAGIEPSDIQYQNRFDQERLPSLGTSHPDNLYREPEEQRGYASINRTGRFTKDMVFDLSPEEAKVMAAETQRIREYSLGPVAEANSQGKWKKKLPSPKAQDDFEIDYTV